MTSFVHGLIVCLCVLQFVEKRREMKADGRTDKELEESYCFLLADAVKVRLTLNYVVSCWCPTGQDEVLLS